MQTITDVLASVKSGRISLRRAESLLRLNSVAIVGDLARLDYNRYLRRGIPEIVYARSKSTDQLLSIVSKLMTKRDSNTLPLIISKVRKDQAKALSKNWLRKNGSNGFYLRYYEDAEMIAIDRNNVRKQKSTGRVALLAAGTSDIPALNESEVLLDLLGCSTIRFNDVGIAALHRLSGPLKKVFEFEPDAIIVAAGMEGALPSLIAGLSDVPVIGLPTSIGYGYGKNGEAALMSMLQACPLGICVVNIDAGVAAAVVAWLIARRANRLKRSVPSA
ncbi:MAG: nickel pincer cofactor biosynthesis protein LarB [Thaumarchaeota archaeon]|nr:nickel pincer cofactor biosynthesis protein LarB [Nitrososphaerota archaeon]MDG6907676.1 nickel pincer cofactor biosynthesis protein LarB [Nitrososphaerota archaeon]